MAVTANQLIVRQAGEKVSYPVSTVDIYQGTLVFLDTNGYAVRVTGSGHHDFGGIAIAEVDNDGGSAGDKNVECWTEGVFELTGSGFAQTSVGQPVYATDNYTLTLTPGASAVRIGTIVGYVSSTKVLVKIEVVDPPVLMERESQTATADTATITAAQLLTKVLEGVPTAAATYTLPTAALLVAAIPDAKVGDSFEFIISNNSAGANTITVAAGSGGTADGTLTVAQNVVRKFHVLITNVTAASEAYYVYGIG